MARFTPPLQCGLKRARVGPSRKNFCTTCIGGGIRISDTSGQEVREELERRLVEEVVAAAEARQAAPTGKEQKAPGFVINVITPGNRDDVPNEHKAALVRRVAEQFASRRQSTTHARAEPVQQRRIMACNLCCKLFLRLLPPEEGFSRLQFCLVHLQRSNL